MRNLSWALLLLAFVSCRQEGEANKKMETIKYIERASGELKTENVPSEGMLHWLYASATGKLTLNLLFKRKVVSALGGWYMNTRWSARRTADFVKEHRIDMDEYAVSNADDYKTFNEFFYRKLKAGARPIGEHLVSPADGKILVFPTLSDVDSFFVKGSEFSLQSFLCNDELTTKYANGSMAIVRLAPPDYHRYHFPASGTASESVKIEGHYYSVSPLALRGSLEIFCQNKREYTTLQTTEYGDILIMDVGATMVGSIIQTYSSGRVEKGSEKGYFAFGGSTLVLLFEAGKISFDPDLVQHTQNGLETTIRMGENIASGNQ